jgi:TfoX/Sxy family transcriptional regulator of competence genes
MSTDKSFADFVVEQLAVAGDITCKKMFGEYGVYCDGKIVALLCDNRLFIKPTEAGRAYIGEVVLAPPYPGAKDYFLIEEQLDDTEWLGRLVRLSADELPQPKPKKAREKKKSPAVVRKNG